MAYVICQPCVGTKNAACLGVCPVGAIHPTENETDFLLVDQLFIDPERCIECALCAATCPVGAIYQESDVPVGWEEYIRKNAEYYNG
jgi:Fe-S-cluster-containing hydrogenase component 2